MGTCFGRCSTANMRKSKKKRNIFCIKRKRENQDEEFLELEQKETNEANNVCEEQICEVTLNPPKLNYKKSNFRWLRKENIVLGTIQHLKNMKSPVDSIMPLLNRNNSFADTVSSTGSQKWDQLSLGAVTPNSSVDLEWENEIGFNSTANFGASAEQPWMVLTENTNNSWRSSPLSNSNGLEWDGDFNSMDVNEIIAETQRLTNDIPNNLSGTADDIENNN